MKIFKHMLALVAACLVVAGGQGLRAAQAVEPKIDTPPAMPVPKVDLTAWRPEEPAADAKPVSVLLLKKGDDREAFVIKQVSVCDQNNIWCVANDGTKDAVYQLTEKGLDRRFDGVFVSAGHDIVTAINEKQEVFELKGRGDTTWEKIEGLKLTQIYRPSEKIGWGLLEEGPGKTTLLMLNEAEGVWEAVQNANEEPAKGVVALAANAEDIAVVLTDKGEILKRDLSRVNLVEKAKAVVAEMKKRGGKKGKRGAASDDHHDIALGLTGVAPLPAVPTLPKDLSAVGNKVKKQKKHKKNKNHEASHHAPDKADKKHKKHGKKKQAAHSGKKDKKSKKDKKDKKERKNRGQGKTNAASDAAQATTTERHDEGQAAK